MSAKSECVVAKHKWSKFFQIYGLNMHTYGLHHFTQKVRAQSECAKQNSKVTIANSPWVALAIKTITIVLLKI